MEEALLARLRATTAISTIAQQRGWWLQRPQVGALPSYTLQVITGDRDYHHAGPTDMQTARVQIDCWGTTYADAKKLSRAIRNELEQARIVNAVRFGNSFQDASRDMDPESLAGGVTVHRVSLDFYIYFKE